MKLTIWRKRIEKAKKRGSFNFSDAVHLSNPTTCAIWELGDKLGIKSRPYGRICDEYPLAVRVETILYKIIRYNPTKINLALKAIRILEDIPNEI